MSDKKIELKKDDGKKIVLPHVVEACLKAGWEIADKKSASAYDEYKASLEENK